MKKLLFIILMILTILPAAACQGGAGETVPAPDIIGMEVSDAKMMIAGDFSLNEVEVPSHEYLPGTVISYGADIEVGDPVETGATVDVNVSAQPENAYSYSDEVWYVSAVDYVTGPESPNEDILMDAGVGGTDLGIPVEYEGDMLLLYGDTFSGVGSHSGLWFSNFIARSEDFTLHDGLEFSSVVTNDSGMAKPFYQGLHNLNQSDEEADNPDREVTKIPTGGVTIDGTLYIFFMSVRYWGAAGEWLVNYNQVVKSTDLDTFTPMESLTWTEEEAPNFGQIYPVKDPHSDYVYLMSTPGGRSGGTVLSRVLESDIEDRSQYEYLIAEDTWVKGADGLAALRNDPYFILNPPCAEMGAMYNDYLEKWVAVYMKGGEIIMRTADSLEGPWSSSETLIRGSDYFGLYGGFPHRLYTDFDGQKFYLQVSRWLPIYQTQLFEVVLD